MERKTVIGTGGELLVHQLLAQGVDYAFTNTGSAEVGFFNGLLAVPGVQPILLLMEPLVLSAADGYAKASGKPAFINIHLAAGTRQWNSHVDGSGPYAFILDTGAALCMLAPSLASRLGVVATESREGRGAGGPVRISLGKVRTLAIGPHEAKDLEVGISDEVDRITAAVGTRLDGNVGYNYLKSFRLTLDYARGELHLQARPRPGHGLPVIAQDQASRIASANRAGS